MIEARNPPPDRSVRSAVERRHGAPLVRALAAPGIVWQDRTHVARHLRTLESPAKP